MTEHQQRLAGRVAIVTGASRGLGRHIATAFAREGASVAVVARTESQWDERLPGTVHDVVAEIEEAGGRAVAVPADLAKPDDVERLVATARDALGPIDLLVNNAALTVPGRPPSPGAGQAAGAAAKPAAAAEGSRPKQLSRSSFVDFPLKGYRMHFEVGVMASYRLMQLVLPDMIEAGRGSIVNVTSAASLFPGDGPYAPGTQALAAYGGNKAALEHLTRCVALDVQELGISVNALSPSFPVWSPGNMFAAVGVNDFGDPDDFAEATVRTALCDPGVTTGRVLWHEDVLHPDRPPLGWQATRG